MATAGSKRRGFRPRGRAALLNAAGGCVIKPPSLRIIHPHISYSMTSFPKARPPEVLLLLAAVAIPNGAAELREREREREGEGEEGKG